MGTAVPRRKATGANHIMKGIVAIFALAALAAAEPQYSYNSGSGSRIYGYDSGASGYGNIYGYRSVYKREAEAEPEYSYGTYGSPIYGYNSGASGYGNIYGYRSVYKREAEAEPQYGSYGTYGSNIYGY